MGITIMAECTITVTTINFTEDIPTDIPCTTMDMVPIIETIIPLLYTKEDFTIWEVRVNGDCKTKVKNEKIYYR